MFSLALAGRDLALGHNPARVCSKTHTHECGAREKGAAKQTSMRACTRLGRARLQEASEVKRRRARLVPGWGTAHGRYWRSAGRRPVARRRPDVRGEQNLDPCNSRRDSTVSRSQPTRAAEQATALVAAIAGRRQKLRTRRSPRRKRNALAHGRGSRPTPRPKAGSPFDVLARPRGQRPGPRAQPRTGLLQDAHPRMRCQREGSSKADEHAGLYPTRESETPRSLRS